MKENEDAALKARVSELESEVRHLRRNTAELGRRMVALENETRAALMHLRRTPASSPPELCTCPDMDVQTPRDLAEGKPRTIKGWKPGTCLLHPTLASAIEDDGPRYAGLVPDSLALSVCPAHGAHPHEGMTCLDCPECDTLRKAGLR